MLDHIVSILYILFMYIVAKPGNKVTESLKKSRDRSTSVDSQVCVVFVSPACTLTYLNVVIFLDANFVMNTSKFFNKLLTMAYRLSFPSL